MALQPVYATPNFFDGTADHRMSLQGRDINAVIRCGTDPLEESILWAVQRNGLPALPAAPRTQAEQDAIVPGGAQRTAAERARAGDTACRQSWPRHPAADMASTYWRLSGEVPPFENFVPGGSHIPNGTIFFVTGQAQNWLDMQRRTGPEADRHNSSRTVRTTTRVQYQRGHFEDTANGLCAAPAARLLEFAYITGDAEALQAGLRTLEYMKRFDTPRGAQIWEIPLHTPDQLASAYLVWAYTRGYQLTGNAEYLREARRWALSGIPFTYLWGRYPDHGLRDTSGLRCHQLDRAELDGPAGPMGRRSVCLRDWPCLAPHESDTRLEPPRARHSDLALNNSSIPTVRTSGLLPDSFNLAAMQRRQPADINPCALVSLQRLLDGQPEFLSVAVEGNRRVASPFPVTIAEGNGTDPCQCGDCITNADRRSDDRRRAIARHRRSGN